MMTGFRLNFTPLKEPLGFVKLVEWLTAIFAFGCCGGYSGKNIVSLFCGDGRNETLDANFHYPFRLSQVPLVEVNATLCNRSVTATHMVGDSASSAEFFVGIAVVCFLYSMVALLVYLGYMHVYKDSDFGPIFVSIDLFWSVLPIVHLKPTLQMRDLSSSAGLCDHGHPGLPVAGVFVRLGEGPAECEGRHGHGGHRRHAGTLQGEQRHLRGHRVRQHEDPQHLCGVWLPQHVSVGGQRLVCV
ncbi:synaptophysin-like protein 1 isoform X1 [Anarhichas minor]|uniref:synaptophysin-like protein 1 isoform X1 n=1 Tax=Anarhichas minor TaxID=65739 RepID=UPI003F7392A1